MEMREIFLKNKHGLVAKNKTDLANHVTDAGQGSTWLSFNFLTFKRKRLE